MFALSICRQLEQSVASGFLWMSWPQMYFKGVFYFVRSHCVCVSVSVTVTDTHRLSVTDTGRIRLVKFRPTTLGSAHFRTVKMLLTEAGQANGKFCSRSNLKHGDTTNKFRSVCGTSHSSPEVSAQFPILCMYLMGSNWSSAYRSASRGKLLLLLLCIVRLQLGSRWVRVRVSCRVRFSVRVSFTVRVSVRVIQVAILSCKLWGNSTTSNKFNLFNWLSLNH